MTGLPPRDATYTPARNLDAKVFEGEGLTLFGLHRASIVQSQAAITGRVFRNCGIEGPAVALILDGVRFESCDFGNTGGDIRNILLRPVSPTKVIGAIPIRDCLFIGCRFYAVGFTGSEAFITEMSGIQTRP